MGGFDHRHRPGYHFAPTANWMNDPNGLIYHQGRYHMFYQYNPYGAFHGTIHWGHVVSQDMLHWEHWPMALAPIPGSPDWAGCYSGCAVNNQGVPTLVYTGIKPETQCIAESRDGLRTFQKPTANPVVAVPPAGLQTTGFRDPCVWAENDGWHMIIGSGLVDQGGTILSYSSPDLYHWQYDGQLCSGEMSDTGTMWECPNFFALGEEHMLIFSPIPLDRVLCMTGHYANKRFTRRNLYDVDASRIFYAPQTLLVPDGRRIMWGWLREGRSRAAQIEAGWSGVMSLPREIGLDDKGHPTWRVADEVDSLRQQSLLDERITLPAGTHCELTRGKQLEIRLQVGSDDLAAPFTLGILAAADGSEACLLHWDGHTSLTLDTTQASSNPDTYGEIVKVNVQLDKGEPLHLAIYVDVSVIEVLVNERYALTGRAYPESDSAEGLSLSANEKVLTLQQVRCWSMANTGV